MICSALFDLNVIRSELKMEWLWLSLLSSKNFHLLLLSSRWTHLQLYIHAIERCIIANMLQQYENIKRYIVKNNGCSRMKKLCYFWKFYVILRVDSSRAGAQRSAMKGKLEISVLSLTPELRWRGVVGKCARCTLLENVRARTSQT